MPSLLETVLTAPAIDPHHYIPLREIAFIRAAYIENRFRNGTAPCGERPAVEAVLCGRRRQIDADGVAGGCLACSRAGV